VSDIQHYAVHDGPGIRTIVFLKGCPLRCPWCCNPESHSGGVELRHLSHRCTLCGRCADVCPAGSIHVEEDHLTIDRVRCPACNAPCLAACNESALERVGTMMSVDDVVERVDADRDFYRNSGGGITISGGEPLAQPAFVSALARACRERSLHVAMETSGFAAADVFQTIAPVIDLFLFDIKVVDPARHAIVTGVDNTDILANLAHLAAARPRDVIVRFAVIPGYTDDEANLDGVARLMRTSGLDRLELGSYHPLGAEKYEALGRSYTCDADPAGVDRQRLAALVDRFTAEGLQVALA
ncbi:MAG: glycyl-radical enzyme activating protein, partial [Acidobacteria bacterium]|nr:glycyl-radical enzyme activating protein [Acidobacteriota bacterium]